MRRRGWIIDGPHRFGAATGKWGRPAADLSASPMEIERPAHPPAPLGAQRAVAIGLIAGAFVLSLGIGAPFEKDQEPQSAQWIEAVARRGERLLPRDDYGGLIRKPP